MPYQSDAEKLAQSKMLYGLLDRWLTHKRDERKSYQQEPKSYQYGGRIIEQDPLTGDYEEVFNVGDSTTTPPDYKKALEEANALYEDMYGPTEATKAFSEKLKTYTGEMSKETYDQLKRLIKTTGPTTPPTPTTTKSHAYTPFGKEVPIGYDSKTGIYTVGGKKFTQKEFGDLGFTTKAPKFDVLEQYNTVKSNITNTPGRNFEDKKRRYFEQYEGAESEFEYLTHARQFSHYLKKFPVNEAMDKYLEKLQKNKVPPKRIHEILSRFATDYFIPVK